MGLDPGDAPSFCLGGLSATLDASIQPHDLIRFTLKTKARIFEECAPLYEKGISLREISKLTGTPKTTIRDTLSSCGVTLRTFKKGRINPCKLPGVMRSGTTPYGYTYLEGKLVVEPSEYRVVLQILKLWQLGKSLTGIAKHLNSQKTPTRLGKSWSHAVLGNIIERHQKNSSQPKTN